MTHSDVVKGCVFMVDGKEFAPDGGARAYKFMPLNQEHHFNNIENNAIFFRQAENYNDPFEGLLKITYSAYDKGLEPRYEKTVRCLMSKIFKSHEIDGLIAEKRRELGDRAMYIALREFSNLFFDEHIEGYYSNHMHSCFCTNDHQLEALTNPLMWGIMQMG